MKKLLLTLVFLLGFLVSSTGFATETPVPIQSQKNREVVSNPEPELIPIVACWHSTTETTYPDGTVVKKTTTICIVVII